MEKRTRNLRLVGRDEVSLGELIHQTIRRTIEQAVEEEPPPGRAPWRAERASQLTDQVLGRSPPRQLPPRVLNEGQVRSAGERANR